MDTLDYQPGTNPPVPIISVQHQFKLARYLVRRPAPQAGPQQTLAPATLRECSIQELSPTARRVRVLWELVPIDQEWLDADTLWGDAVEELVGDWVAVPATTQTRPVLASPDQQGIFRSLGIPGLK